MPQKRRRQKPLDRAAEYIASPLMTQRIRYKQGLSARINGNYGVYRTRLQLSRKTESHCTCPSDWWPCKHGRALRATWDTNPKSCLDLEKFLTKLSVRSKASLLEAVGRMVLVAPEALSVFGLKGFEREAVEEDWELEDGSGF